MFLCVVLFFSLFSDTGRWFLKCREHDKHHEIEEDDVRVFAHFSKYQVS